jgi:hypothetical protein
MRSYFQGRLQSCHCWGTNLILAPGLTATASEQGILSPNASCKTFSADADGYARAEGIVAIYIKPLKDALLVSPNFGCGLQLQPQMYQYKSFTQDLFQSSRSRG